MPSSTTSQPELRALDTFDSIASGSSWVTPKRINNGSNKSPIRFGPRCFLRDHLTAVSLPSHKPISATTQTLRSGRVSIARPASYERRGTLATWPTSIHDQRLAHCSNCRSLFAEKRFSLPSPSETQKWVQFCNVYPCLSDRDQATRLGVRSPDCFSNRITQDTRESLRQPRSSALRGVSSGVQRMCNCLQVNTLRPYSNESSLPPSTGADRLSDQQ